MGTCSRCGQDRLLVSRLSVAFSDISDRWLCGPCVEKLEAWLRGEGATGKPVVVSTGDKDFYPYPEK